MNLILKQMVLFQPAKPATYINSESVICQMESPRTANITVSYGGERQSNIIRYVVYDSFCDQCDEDTLICVERVRVVKKKTLLGLKIFRNHY